MSVIGDEFLRCFDDSASEEYFQSQPVPFESDALIAGSVIAEGTI